uniref:Btz domain-containing protein n=1 Tax=Meloidogyne hapla TaxID=6305 RepID=A0A1I8BMP7_MELHA
MPSKIKREPNSPKNGEIDEGEDLVLDFVEEAGDELEESDRVQSPRSISQPRSPDAREETVILQADAEDDSNENERKMKNNKQLGPKTPPGSDEEDNDKLDDKDDDYLTVEERLRQNKKARLVRLRDARSRHLGYKYVPRMGGKPGFPPQPYFKNPSYYPDDSRDKAKPPNPPPVAQKIDPLPGGRLPLVQRRSSPAPFDRSSSSGRHSPPYRSTAPRRVARGIVEEVFTVRASGRDSNGGHYIFTGSKYVPRPWIPPPPPGKKWNCPRRDEP